MTLSIQAAETAHRIPAKKQDKKWPAAGKRIPPERIKYTDSSRHKPPRPTAICRDREPAKDKVQDTAEPRWYCLWWLCSATAGAWYHRWSTKRGSRRQRKNKPSGENGFCRRHKTGRCKYRSTGGRYRAETKTKPLSNRQISHRSRKPARQSTANHQ